MSIRMLSFGLPVVWVCQAAIGGDTVLYVDDGASPGGDGLSWETAFADVQEALDAASPLIEQIRIAEGTYLPSWRSDADEARSATFRISVDREVLGGFAGPGASDPDERDPALYQTVLSGDLAGDDEPGFVNRSDNVYHVVTAESPCVLDGLTIRSGYADLEGTPGGKGGGLRIGFTVPNDLPVIRECTFEENLAVDLGGGIHTADNGGLLSIQNCSFRGNVAGIGPMVGDHGRGGAIFKSAGRLEVIDCGFDENLAGRVGAGIRLEFAEELSISGCVFSDNETEVAAAWSTKSVQSTTVRDCVCTDNCADAGAGCFTVDSGSVTMIDCVFRQNVGGNGFGAGVVEGQTSTYVNCLFAANSSGFVGGALAESSDDLSMTNCVFSRNVALDEGALEILTGVTATLVNCTFSGNEPSGLYAQNSAVFVTNSIFWGNFPHQIETAFTFLTVTDCDVQNGWSGPGNIDADPLFVQGGLDDTRLAFGSPCLDAGDTSDLPADVFDLDGDGDTDEPIPFGLDGEVRVAGAAVDLGAYEGAHEPQPPAAGAFDIDQGEVVFLVPGGGPIDVLTRPLVIFRNIAGPDNASATVVQHESDLHPEAGGFSEEGILLAIETTLEDGAFLMTMSIPFGSGELDGIDPFDLDATFFNEATGRWSLGVTGNMQPSPDHTGPVGDRILVEGGPIFGTTGEAGDFGVYWDPSIERGLVWANLDHATDFGFGVNLCPADCAPIWGDGSVGVTDLIAVVLGWSIGEADGVCDVNRDGSIDTFDLTAVVSAWGGCP